MNQENKLKETWSTKRIIVLLALIIIIPLTFYGVNAGVRIYRLYQIVYEPIDDEAIASGNPGFFDPDEITEGGSQGDPTDPIEGDPSDGSSGEESEPVEGFPGFQYSKDDLDLVSIKGENVWDYQEIDRPFYQSTTAGRNSNHINILLLGLDEAIDEPGRSDSIMVMQLNIESKESAILSIPRDTYVQIPGHGYDKAGHAMAYGGTSLAKKTIENFLDISIDHYIRVDMSGFEDSVDALGGITVGIPERMVEEGGKVLFEAGTQHMNGEDVLEYTRARKLQEGPGGDLGRIQRQQQVVFEMLQKIRSDLSLNQTLSFLEEISPYIRTDVSPRLIINHWRVFNRLDFQEMNLRTLPGINFTHQDIYYFRVPVENARMIMDNMTD